MLPQNRKLTEQQKDHIKDVKAIGGSKLKLLATLHNEGVKTVLRDISNVHA